MNSDDGLRAAFGSALAGSRPGLSRADRLCHACVDLLAVDGAAISVMEVGASRGTFGSSSELSRRLDEYQFTFGEGPCMDSVRDAHQILEPDLSDPTENRWPAFAPAVLATGVRAVFALPVAVSQTYVGVLDLFRAEPGNLAGADLAGGLMASHLAALPLLDLISAEVDWAALGEGDAWAELESLERVEVYQATGMVMGQLGVTHSEALVRLRAHAFAHGMTASEVSWALIAREITLDADDSWRDPSPQAGLA